MAIPDRPLELNINVNELTLDEMVLFSEKGFNWFDFRQFLIDHVINWTHDEIGAVTIGELQKVAEQIREAVEQNAVPLAN